MEIKSDFALLDVKGGREKLFEHFKNRPFMGECPEELRMPVTITGYIDGVWGGDDGVSREFSVTVENVETTSATALIRKIAAGWDGKGSFFADYFNPLRDEAKALLGEAGE